MKKAIVLVMALACSLVLLSGCSRSNGGMQDGYFTAEVAEYQHGWKEFVTICVKGGRIVSLEYNAKNSSGFIKSWDIAYMRNMDRVKGMYPNRYTREYARQLLEKQSHEEIDAVSGATSSGGTFVQLAEAAIAASKANDTSVIIVQAAE